MYRNFIPFVSLLAVFFGIFAVLTNTPWLLNNYGARMLEDKFPGVRVENLKIGRQQFRLPDELRLFDVSLAVKNNGILYQIDMPKALLKGTLRSLSHKDSVQLAAAGVNIRTANWELKNSRWDMAVPMDALRSGIVEGQGMMSAEQARFYRGEMSDVQTRFQIRRDELQVLESSAGFYGGKFKGVQISYKFDPAALFISWLELEGLKAEKLVSINRLLFEGLDGEARGSWRLVGDSRKVEVLAIILSMPQGGKASPALLRRLAAKVGESSRAQLAEILASDQPLVFERASLHIQNIDPHTVALVVAIENKAQNIFIQDRILINIPEGLHAYFFRPVE